MDVAKLGNQQRLTIIFDRAATRLGGDAGAQLKAMVTPQAIATMVVILVAWAASHFFGVGEVADLVLLIVGYVALGGVAVEAAHHLFDFGKLAINGRTESDLNSGAEHLSKAVTLIGIQAVLAILLKKKPGTFKNEFTRASGGKPLPGFRTVFPKPLPRVAGQWRYRPTLRFTKKKMIGEGGTSAVGDIRIGRDHYGATAAARSEAMRLTLFHEKVHQMLIPKLHVLREVRIYAQMGAYRRSYVIRYLEEMMAEVYAQFRVFGFDKERIFSGFKFPLNPRYEITVSALKSELKGVLLGPVVVGGMVFHAAYGLIHMQGTEGDAWH